MWGSVEVHRFISGLLMVSIVVLHMTSCCQGRDHVHRESIVIVAGAKKLKAERESFFHLFPVSDRRRGTKT